MILFSRYSNATCTSSCTAELQHYSTCCHCNEPSRSPVPKSSHPMYSSGGFKHSRVVGIQHVMILKFNAFSFEWINHVNEWIPNDTNDSGKLPENFPSDAYVLKLNMFCHDILVHAPRDTLRYVVKIRDAENTKHDMKSRKCMSTTIQSLQCSTALTVAQIPLVLFRNNPNSEIDSFARFYDVCCSAFTKPYTYTHVLVINYYCQIKIYQLLSWRIRYST